MNPTMQFFGDPFAGLPFPSRDAPSRHPDRASRSSWPGLGAPAAAAMARPPADLMGRIWAVAARHALPCSNLAE